MNNVRSANVIILKQPIIKEAEDNSENYIYPITAAP